MIVREPGGTIVSDGPIVSDEAIVSGGAPLSLIHHFFKKHFYLIEMNLWSCHFRYIWLRLFVCLSLFHCFFLFQFAVIVLFQVSKGTLGYFLSLCLFLCEL